MNGLSMEHFDRGYFLSTFVIQHILTNDQVLSQIYKIKSFYVLFWNIFNKNSSYSHMTENDTDIKSRFGLQKLR